ncbi:MAG: APC family permease [Nannocystaceae bacterium]
MVDDAGDRGLRRELGVWDAIAVVIGAIVGVGIFFTPSRVVTLAGSGGGAMAAWVLGGLAAMTGALTFAALGMRFPRNGGQYVALREAYGPGLGFVYVVCNATAVQAGAIALIALVCVYNTAEALALPELSQPAATGGALAFILVLCGANILGVQWGKRIQNATALAKVATLLVIVAVASVYSERSPAEVVATANETERGWIQGVVAALVPVMFTFGGWQQVLWLGGEVREPSKTLPRSVIAGVAVVVVIYIMVNGAYLALLGPSRVSTSNALAAEAVGVAVGDIAGRLVAAGVAISAFGVLNAQLLSGPRLVLALARDGKFFSIFGKLHARFATPMSAIMLLGGVACAILVGAGEGGISAIDQILTGVVLVDGLFFGLTGLAVPVLHLRARRAGVPVAWGSPGVIAASLFVCVEVGVVIGAWLDPQVRAASLIGLGWIVATLALYLLRFRATASPENSSGG